MNVTKMQLLLSFDGTSSINYLAKLTIVLMYKFNAALINWKDSIKLH
jgi:hypothetical protein